MNSDSSNSSLYYLVIRTLALSLCLGVFAVRIESQDFKTVHDGVEYAQVDHKLGSEPVKINLLRLDLTKVRLDVHHAMDAAIGTEKASSIAIRHGAVAAINGGFFRLDSSVYAGEAAGILQIDGQLLSESLNERSALFILNFGFNTEVLMGRPATPLSVSLGPKSLDISGINRERKDNELILYTNLFHRTTLTNPGGIEVAVIGNSVFRVYPGLGNNPIPQNGYVLSATGTMAEEVREVATGKLGVTLHIGVTAGRDGIGLPDPGRFGFLRFRGYWDITNGVSQLTKGGKINLTWEDEKASKTFAETRHPRTAVAKLKDGKFLMMTVDGRQPEVSVGMTLQELAEYLLSLGAVDAMNLDGGGSTTMFLDGKVVNTPSDKEGERKVGDAILVTLRKKPPVKK